MKCGFDRWGMRRGDIVYCDLLGAWEHTGIYAGRGKIIHLVNELNQYGKDGKIVSSDAREFVNRCGGMNPSSSIYVACEADGSHVGYPFYATRAEQLRRMHRGYGYDLILKNCHQFTSKCIGCEEHIVFPFWNLEKHLREDYDFDHWEECMGMT